MMPDTVIARLRQHLLLDPYCGPIDQIVARVSRLGPSVRRGLLALCSRTLNSPRLRSNQALRVSTVKVLIALLPSSRKIVESWVVKPLARGVCEVQFTLFCFLDDVQYDPRLRQFAAQVPSMIGEYLMRADSDCGSAAWMAGDLLGDHWRPSASVPILLRVARESRHAVGRSAAVHGLGKCLSRVRARRQTQLQNCLEEIAKTDRSTSVKAAARVALLLEGRRTERGA
jgi:hypothetical protein